MIKKINNKKGFTLIELIVVIAILGILTAMVVPKFGGFTEQAKEKADKTSANVIKEAVLVAIANGDIIPGNTNGTITINNDGSYDHTVIVIDNTDLKNTMASLLGSDVKAQSSGKLKFIATITPEGDVTVDTE